MRLYNVITPTATTRSPIPKHTGPLAILTRRKVLVIVDDENLRCGARDLGFKVSYRALGALLTQTARAVALHTVFSCEVHDRRRRTYFTRAGWTPHTRTIERVRTSRGTERQANADNLILFLAGRLASRSPAETIVVGSGDGQLVADLAAALRDLPTRRQVVTLSLAGSTSYRLDATRNPAITANIELGRDCLRPLWR